MILARKTEDATTSLKDDIKKVDQVKSWEDEIQNLLYDAMDESSDNSVVLQWNNAQDEDEERKCKIYENCDCAID